MPLSALPLPADEITDDAPVEGGRAAAAADLAYQNVRLDAGYATYIRVTPGIASLLTDYRYRAMRTNPEFPADEGVEGLRTHERGFHERFIAEVREGLLRTLSGRGRRAGVRFTHKPEPQRLWTPEDGVVTMHETRFETSIEAAVHPEAEDTAIAATLCDRLLERRLAEADALYARVLGEIRSGRRTA